MPTGSRRNTKNLTAAKMPPKGTKRMAESNKQNKKSEIFAYMQKK